MGASNRRRQSIAFAAMMWGGAQASGQCQFGVGGLNIPIPDMGSASYTLNGFGSGSVVTSVRLCIKLVHPRQGDLVVRLSHSGITATLLNRPGTEDGQSTEGYTAANFGGSPGGSFTLSDDAPMPYAVPPVGGTPRPGISDVFGAYTPTVDPLSTFAGTPVSGDWTVTISDAAPGFSGTFYVVSMAINAVLVGPCWANCDGSIFEPGLTANDFQCFLDAYVAGYSYANCDGSTGIPALTANDFLCFLNKFVAGCS